MKPNPKIVKILTKEAKNDSKLNNVSLVIDGETRFNKVCNKTLVHCFDYLTEN